MRKLVQKLSNKKKKKTELFQSFSRKSAHHFIGVGKKKRKVLKNPRNKLTFEEQTGRRVDKVITDPIICPGRTEFFSLLFGSTASIPRWAYIIYMRTYVCMVVLIRQGQSWSNQSDVQGKP